VEPVTAGTAASPPTRSSRHGAVWSRRRLLGGMVGLAGAGAVAAFAGLAVTGDSRLAGLRRLVRRPSVSVVMPRGGVLAGTNSALAGTIERILPDVVDAGRGRFTLDLVGFDHTLPDLTEFFAPSGAPAAERWALARARQPGPFPGSQFAALASQASAGRPADVFILTSYPEVGATPNELVAAARFVRPLAAGRVLGRHRLHGRGVRSERTRRVPGQRPAGRPSAHRHAAPAGLRRQPFR
jgi:hypothetical protein